MTSNYLCVGGSQCHSSTKHLLLYSDVPWNFLHIEITELVKQPLSSRRLQLGMKAGRHDNIIMHKPSGYQAGSKKDIKEGFLQEVYLNQVMPYK